MLCSVFSCKEYGTTCELCKKTYYACNPTCEKCKHYKKTCAGHNGKDRK